MPAHQPAWLWQQLPPELQQRVLDCEFGHIPHLSQEITATKDKLKLQRQRLCQLRRAVYKRERLARRTKLLNQWKKQLPRWLRSLPGLREWFESNSKLDYWCKGSCHCFFLLTKGRLQTTLLPKLGSWSRARMGGSVAIYCHVVQSAVHCCQPFVEQLFDELYFVPATCHCY